MSEGTEVKKEKNAWDGMLMKMVVRIKMTMGTNTNGRRNKIKKKCSDDDDVADGDLYIIGRFCLSVCHEK